jgi:hypothetical protein
VRIQQLRRNPLSDGYNPESGRYSGDSEVADDTQPESGEAGVAVVDDGDVWLSELMTSWYLRWRYTRPSFREF